MMEHLPHLPRLLYDVLDLTKEQQRLQFEKDKQILKSLPTNKNKWNKDFGIVLSTIMLGFSVVIFTEWLTVKEVAGLSFIIGLSGGIVSLLKSNFIRS